MTTGRHTGTPEGGRCTGRLLTAEVAQRPARSPVRRRGHGVPDLRRATAFSNRTVAGPGPKLRRDGAPGNGFTGRPGRQGDAVISPPPGHRSRRAHRRRSPLHRRVRGPGRDPVRPVRALPAARRAPRGRGLPTVFATPGDKAQVIVPDPGAVTVALGAAAARRGRRLVLGGLPRPGRGAGQRARGGRGRGRDPLPAVADGKWIWSWRRDPVGLCSPTRGGAAR